MGASKSKQVPITSKDAECGILGGDGLWAGVFGEIDGYCGGRHTLSCTLTSGI